MKSSNKQRILTYPKFLRRSGDRGLTLPSPSPPVISAMLLRELTG